MPVSDPHNGTLRQYKDVTKATASNVALPARAVALCVGYRKLQVCYALL